MGRKATHSESPKRVKTSLGKGLHTELKRILAAIFLSDGKAPMVIEVVDEAMFDWIKKRKGRRK